MKAKAYLPRVGVILLLAAVLFAALTPASPGLLLFLLIAPQWFFSAVTVSAPLRVFDEKIRKPQALALAVFSPRPPPAL
ncbi:MAG: hypothetical protein WA581_07125 [Candidatus Acidiferrales bacterium]